MCKSDFVGGILYIYIYLFLFFFVFFCFFEGGRRMGGGVNVFRCVQDEFVN